jgi:Uma2 family endonuclease
VHQLGAIANAGIEMFWPALRVIECASDHYREISMSLALQHTSYSTAEYLDMEFDSSVKHEYIAGEVYAMSGASERHNRIAGNAYYRFRTAARGGPCGVYISDMKLRIQAQNSFYYPDVMLTCQADDDHPLYKTAPCIVVEVLSPSTAAIDRREKWLAYRGIASLTAYLLIDAEQRRAEYFQRDETGGWKQGVLEGDEILNLQCGALNIPLSLDDLYEDVRFAG